MKQLTILYETTDVGGKETISVAHPKEPRGEDDIRYERDTGHWHVTRREQSDGSHVLNPMVIPRERVYRIVALEVYDAEKHQYKLQDDDWQRIRYANLEEPLEDPDERREIASPITYNVGTAHWECAFHNPYYTEEGDSFVYRLQIPREKVYWATK